MNDLIIVSRNFSATASVNNILIIILLRCVELLHVGVSSNNIITLLEWSVRNLKANGFSIKAIAACVPPVNTHLADYLEDVKYEERSLIRLCASYFSILSKEKQVDIKAMYKRASSEKSLLNSGLAESYIRLLREED